MTSKHTPGPWQALPEEMGKHYLRVRGTVLGLRYKIANVLHVEYEGAPETESKMTKANARLIAAAPELLDALIEAVKCGMVPISSAKDGGASTHSRQVRCADMIRAAIAKATGGAQ